MINSLKTIAVFGVNFTGNYRYPLAVAFDKAAHEIGVNLVYMNFIGRVGTYGNATFSPERYGDHELDFLDAIDLDRFDGIIFDGDFNNLPNLEERITEKLRTAKCPVVSISTYVEGFHNVVFDDIGGFRQVVEHLLDHHHFTKIGFMSGYLTHPDAQGRLKEFQRIMRSRGLPENGAGFFEGDFWFNKGDAAAEYFLSLPERPEAIVCANDYMAISLVSALKQRGIRVPEDIAVTGFDGLADGQNIILPHLTTASRQQDELASSVLRAMIALIDKDTEKFDVTVRSRMIINHSCGCRKVDYRIETGKIDEAYKKNRHFNYHLLDAEAALLRLNKVDDFEKLGDVFRDRAVNFGDYKSFFLMLYTDSEGRISCSSDFDKPTHSFSPVIWIDKNDEYAKPEGCLADGDPLPHSSDERPHTFILTSVHTAESIFGYAAIEMDNDGSSREFYILWLMILSMQLETLQKNDRINRLIESLESKSLSDDLTGAYNRRGFYKMAMETMPDDNTPISTFVIDIDRLKRINDEYGHYEGDASIRAAARIIQSCCDNGEICGRTGGDEFSVFARGLDEEGAQRFIERLREETERYCDKEGKPYSLSMSCGYCTAQAGTHIDEMLKVSDYRMYEQKSKGRE